MRARAFELGWKPQAHILASVASSIGGAPHPRPGVQASKGNHHGALGEAADRTRRRRTIPMSSSTLAFCRKYNAGGLQRRGQHAGAGPTSTSFMIHARAQRLRPIR